MAEPRAESERASPSAGSVAEWTSARWRARIAAAWGSVAIAAICVGMFVAMLVRCGGRSGWGAVVPESLWSMGACDAELTSFGALDVARVWLDGQWWRVASAGLLHGSWVHLILNVWSLWVVGWWVERAWGTGRLVAIFVVGSLGGCLASAAWAEAPVVVGASAGILAIAGALWVGRRFGSSPVRERLEPISATALGTMIAVLVGLGFVVPVIAQAGHLGGLAVGVVLGWGWREPGSARAGLSYGATAALLLVLAYAARAPTWRASYHEFRGYALLERDEVQRAVIELDRALHRKPDDPSLANAIAYGLAEAGAELDRAQRLVQQALEAEPDNADYVDTLGWILCRRGDVESGMEQLRRASELSGGEVDEIEGHLVECSDAAVEP